MTQYCFQLIMSSIFFLQVTCYRRIYQVLLLSCFLTLESPAIAQRFGFSQPCSFNGVKEVCDLRDIRKNGKYLGTSILWKSDGKRVDYFLHDCNGNDARTYCKVKIVEDNGRITYGSAELGGRGTVITSSRGNKTWYPPFWFFVFGYSSNSECFHKCLPIMCF